MKIRVIRTIMNGEATIAVMEMATSVAETTTKSVMIMVAETDVTNTGIMDMEKVMVTATDMEKVTVRAMAMIITDNGN
jgi:hypothetical protein